MLIYRSSIEILAALLFIASTPLFSQVKDSDKFFRPGQVWYDTDGNPINAHAGGMLIHEGVYYWFGQIMTPGEGGSDAWVGVSCYRSTDLFEWKNLGVVFSVDDDASSLITRGCKIERPKVIFNRQTGKFVMWWHHDLKGQGHKNALVGVATAENVEGPYKLYSLGRALPGFLPQNIPEKLKIKSPSAMSYTYPFTGGEVPVHPDSLLIFKRDVHRGQMVRDMTLFVDDDEKAYHIYSSEENSTLHLAELTDDYLGYTGKYVRLFAGRFMEAPALFKFNGTYYMVASGCTGWAPNAARSARAKNIFGPWTELKNPCLGPQAHTTYNAQGTHIFPVPHKKNAFIWMADRWNPANPIDGRYVWLPIQIKENNVTIPWMDSWNLELWKE